MNLSSTIGFVIGTLVFVLSVILSFQNATVLLDFNSALMVLGGTAAATLICFPLKQLVVLFRVFLRRVLGSNKRDYQLLIKEIVTLAEARRRGKKAFESATREVTDPFLKDAAGVLFWLNADVEAEELRKLLETRAFTHYKEYMAEARIFRTIAKFPPAFGLMGTTLGMIALLQSLGGGEDAKSLIGPAMAIALVTTLYGLAIANFFLIPIAENLTKQTEEDQKARYMVVEGVMLIQAEKPPQFVEEYVKSFLLPGQRGDANGSDRENRMAA